MSAQEESMRARAERRSTLQAEEQAISSEDLLAYAMGELSGARRSLIEGALERQEGLRRDLRLVVAGVEANATSEVEREFSRRTRHSAGTGTKAAFLLIACAAALVLLWRLDVKRETNSADGTRPTESVVSLLHAEDSWAGPLGSLRGGHDASMRFELLAPNSLVADRRPELIWCAPDSAIEFSVRVIDEAGFTLLNQVVQGHRLAWPADAPSLEANGTYRVLVDVRRGPRRSSSSWFSVMSDEERLALERSLEQLPLRSEVEALVGAAGVLARAGDRAGACAKLESLWPSLSPEDQGQVLVSLHALGAGDVARDLEWRVRSAGLR